MKIPYITRTHPAKKMGVLHTQCQILVSVNLDKYSYSERDDLFMAAVMRVANDVTSKSGCEASCACAFVGGSAIV